MTMANLMIIKEFIISHADFRGYYDTLGYDPDRDFGTICRGVLDVLYSKTGMVRATPVDFKYYVMGEGSFPFKATVNDCRQLWESVVGVPYPDLGEFIRPDTTVLEAVFNIMEANYGWDTITSK